MERFGWTFAPGDKVMQIENDYDKEVYNGDIGYVDDVDPEAGELIANFDGRAVTFGFGELEHAGPGLRHHHPQESGLRVSRRACPGPDPALPHAAAKPSHTGITRGKRLVVLVGQKKAIAIAVRNVAGRRRWSKLDEWLRRGVTSGSSNPSTAD